jgi:pimeloyl-ACP methyl ester carboxylesterase
VLLDEDLKKIRERTGAQKVDLVGMSLGGLIGLYYLKCGGGAPYVDRFISLGGPLNGSTLAHVAAVIPSRFVHAVAQTRPDSEVMRAVQRAPEPAGVRMYSVGTHGDFITPASSWQKDGLETVVSPYGGFPIGHWLLFLHPGNHRIVADLLNRA